MATHRVSEKMFRRIFEEQIRPDLEHRLQHLGGVLEEAEAHGDFLAAWLDATKAMTAWMEAKDEAGGTQSVERFPLPWDELVGPLEIATVVARRRCSIR